MYRIDNLPFWLFNISYWSRFLYLDKYSADYFQTRNPNGSSLNYSSGLIMSFAIFRPLEKRYTNFNKVDFHSNLRIHYTQKWHIWVSFSHFKNERTEILKNKESHNLSAKNLQTKSGTNSFIPAMQSSPLYQIQVIYKHKLFVKVWNERS